MEGDEDEVELEDGAELEADVEDDDEDESDEFEELGEKMLAYMAMAGD